MICTTFSTVTQQGLIVKYFSVVFDKKYEPKESIFVSDVLLELSTILQIN